MLPQLSFTIYVAICFLVTAGGDVLMGKLCYEDMSERLDDLKSHDLLTEVTSPSVSGPRVIVPKESHRGFSSELPDWWIIAGPGTFLFALTFILRVLGPTSWRRSSVIAASFAVTTVVSSAWARSNIGVGAMPGWAVIATSMLLGMTIWWIDYFAATQDFDELVDAVKASHPYEVEKLKLIYEHVKGLARLVTALFLGVCIAGGWNFFSMTKEIYGPPGVDGILLHGTVATIFLTIVGVLGGVVPEIGRRMAKVLNALK